MAIFGISFPKLIVESTSEEILLEESKINYDYFKTDVMEHISMLNGSRKFAYTQNQSSFQLDIVLTNYSSSQAEAKFQQLYQNKNEPLYFYAHEDGEASLDAEGIGVQYYITEFTPYYLDNDAVYDGLTIILSPVKNSVLIPVDTSLGYGFAYALNYGVGL